MMEIFMTIFDKTICIHAENKSIVEDIIHTFAFFIHEKNQFPIDINISIEESINDEYHITYDGKLSACAKINVYPKMCDIIRRSLILKTNLFCFHAAAVEKNGKVYVFISTGNSGKSTLCTALLFRGYKLLTDDTCWIDPINGTIYPYPLAIGTRHKTLDLLPALRDMVIETTFPGKMILPVQDMWVAQPTKSFAYLLWELDFSSSDFRIEKIDTKELTLNLISHSFSYKYCPNKNVTFNYLLNAMKDCHCYFLRGNNLSVLPQTLETIAKNEGVVCF